MECLCSVSHTGLCVCVHGQCLRLPLVAIATDSADAEFYHSSHVSVFLLWIQGVLWEQADAHKPTRCQCCNVFSDSNQCVQKDHTDTNNHSVLSYLDFTSQRSRYCVRLLAVYMQMNEWESVEQLAQTKTSQTHPRIHMEVNRLKCTWFYTLKNLKWSTQQVQQECQTLVVMVRPVLPDGVRGKSPDCGHTHTHTQTYSHTFTHTPSAGPRGVTVIT